MGGEQRAVIVTVPAAIAPLLRRIGEVAEDAGALVYAVGGCVRDWLLGREASTDLDVVVEGDGIGFARRLAQALPAGLTTHEQFGTATLSQGTLRIDVATCRKERYAAPAAYPTVSPGSLSDDLLRRDFTINAMAMRLAPPPYGQLVDPFGGRADLKGKRLRILHPDSFRDDPSRILRGARFASRFGLSLEPGTRRALRQAVQQEWLTKLNQGRLRKELDRLTEEPDPLAALACLSRWLQS